MKSSAFFSTFAASALMALVAGHPHQLKRDMVTDVVWSTVTVANVIVWVDESGLPYSTETLNQVSVVPTTITENFGTTSVSFQVFSSSSVVVTSSSLLVPSATPESSAIPVVTPAPPPLPPPPASSASQPVVSPASVSTSAYVEAVPAPQSSVEPEKPSTASPAPSSEPASPASSARPQSDGRLPIGITYDPYKAQSDCRTADEIGGNFDTMFRSYDIVRIYGNDCGQIPIAVRKAKSNGKKLMAGIYSPNQDISDVVNTIIDAVNNNANGDWSIIPVVSVENERLNEHVMTASGIVDAINKAKDALKFAGFNGLVGAVDTVPATTDNPAICDASDVVLVNAHAFFDSSATPENAGPFVKGQVDQVKKACSNKRVIVTESGWPHQGQGHDNAVPSRANQKTAIESLLGSFDHDLFLFNAFDDPWKSDSASTFDAEKYWGILDG